MNVNKKAFFLTFRAVKVAITLGAHNVGPGSSDQHQVTYILEGADAQSINYPGWYIEKVEDDIALIKLPEDIPLNRKRNTWRSQ